MSVISIEMAPKTEIIRKTLPVYGVVTRLLGVVERPSALESVVMTFVTDWDASWRVKADRALTQLQATR